MLARLCANNCNCAHSEEAAAEFWKMAREYQEKAAKLDVARIGRLVQKCQTLFCQQLAAERGKPKSGKKVEVEDRVVRLLHKDAKMREAFLNKIAAPNANKLFECSMIP